MPEVRSLFAAVLCGSASAAAQPFPSRGEHVNLSAPAVARYEKLEATISLRTQHANPVDPDALNLQAFITTPAGRVLQVPACYYQAYTRARNADGSEALTPVPRGVSGFRFAWGEIGTYHYRIGVTDASGHGDGLGRYDQQSAWRVDYITDLARQRNVPLMLCIDSFHTLTTGLYGNWADSPYNAANGGPCATPADFITNADAKRFLKHRLRYLVARWGYATNVLCWELFNEVDIVDSHSSANVAAWHQGMDGYPTTCAPSTPDSTAPPPASQARRDV